MDYYGLTMPKIYDLGLDVIEEITRANEYFHTNFIDVEDAKYLNGDFIFVRYKFVSGMYERFLHSISMNDKEFYTIFPCTNDNSFISCETRCLVNRSPKMFITIDRALCFYRLARVNWIPEVIKYANENNPNIKIWRKEKKDKFDKWNWKRFVRYENGLADYILVFNELFDDKGDFKMLEFRTAYPVFLKNDKRSFTKEYYNYIKK